MEDEKLNILTEREREVWVLFEQGLTRKQVAQRLDITYSAVATHIRYAKRRFRKYEQLCVELEKREIKTETSLQNDSR